MNILVRLPNWLGDMVMSAGFLHQLPHYFPGATVNVIAKKGIHELLEFFPGIHEKFIFSKEESPGFSGLYQFGRSIRNHQQPDLFFCLPDSFSSALMGYATGAKQRIGYKKEMRELFLTSSYKKPKGLHRVEEYIQQLELFTGTPPATVEVKLQHDFEKKDHIVVNINSEASSRRLTLTKAVEIISQLRNERKEKILLMGGPKESPFVQNVMDLLPDKTSIESIAGKTSLSSLAEVLASARLLLTTDSGPAHLSNALGTPTIVLFGAGDENNTAPYNKEKRKVIRLGKLSCEPCRKNVCVRFGTPQCLELLDTKIIIEEVKEQLENGKRFF